MLVADIDENDDLQNSKIQKYCKDLNYELVWMNQKIEDVFFGKTVSKKEKEKYANLFLMKNV